MATKRTSKAAAATTPTDNGFVEIGRTGLKQWYGIVQDDFLPELRDPVRRSKVYREIRDNSPVVGGAFRAIDNILRDVGIRVEPGGDAPEDLRAFDLVDSAFTDMDVPWSTVLTQAGSMRQYGWAAMEPVYKYRRGSEGIEMVPVVVPGAGATPLMMPSRPKSQYNDGLIGWRKFAPRSQESLERWDFAPGTDDVIGLTQRPAPSFQLLTIPIDNLLLFKIDDDKGSPEGRSLLRNCVLTWKFVKRIQEIEGIGVERDLAGLPVIYAPPNVLAKSAQGDDLAVQRYLEKLITSLRRNEQEGVVLPNVSDAHGKRMYELLLLSTGGTRQFDTNGIIERYEQRMLVTFLADFLLLGSAGAGRGSFALSQDKTDLFTQSLGVYLDLVLEPFNRVEIPRLLALNGIQARPPMLKRGMMGRRDLGVLGTYLAQLATAGLLLPSADGQLEAHLLQVAELPVPKEIVAGDGAVGKRQRWEDALDRMLPEAA